jgi:hypothetical protein
MMAHLLAENRTSREEIKANQEKMDANIKEIRAGQEHLKEEVRAGQEHLFENRVLRKLFGPKGEEVTGSCGK